MEGGCHERGLHEGGGSMKGDAVKGVMLWKGGTMKWSP